MNAFANPVIVNNDTKIERSLTRLPLGAGERQFTEEWLQIALFNNPHCLPVNEIDPHMGALIPVCMEIETGVGPADILFVTPTGQIVIVETKLWRNSEARREVVAQILDYAKQLTSWTYDDLEMRATKAARLRSASVPSNVTNYIISCLRKSGLQFDEALFVDGISRSLKTGDFFLLIIGDGIRSGAESLIGFLDRFGSLKFKLGLIEVAAYQLSDNEILLQPRILAKTEILQRTVLLGSNGNAIEIEQLALAEDAPSKSNSQAEWFEKFWGEYLDKLSLDDKRQPKPSLAKSTNIFFSMPPDQGNAWISAYLAKSSGNAGVYLTFAKSFDRIDEYYDQLLVDKESIEAEFGCPLTWEKDGSRKIYISAPKMTYQNLDQPDERGRVIDYLTDMSNRFVTVFRKRLEAIVQRNT